MCNVAIFDKYTFCFPCINGLKGQVDRGPHDRSWRKSLEIAKSREKKKWDGIVRRTFVGVPKAEKMELYRRFKSFAKAVTPKLPPDLEKAVKSEKDFRRHINHHRNGFRDRPCIICGERSEALLVLGFCKCRLDRIKHNYFKKYGHHPRLQSFEFLMWAPKSYAALRKHKIEKALSRLDEPSLSNFPAKMVRALRGPISEKELHEKEIWAKAPKRKGLCSAPECQEPTPYKYCSEHCT
jgi:hypothetical protein